MVDRERRLGAVQKHWKLTTEENLGSIEQWRVNLMYGLHSEPAFAEFIRPDDTWEKLSVHATRGLQDDAPDNDGNIAWTAAFKNNRLEIMLGMIAGLVPTLNTSRIVRYSTSLANIFKAIHLHYQISKNGALFLDFADMKMEPNEKAEDLYICLLTFVESNLLTVGCGVQTEDGAVAADENITLSLDSIIVITWLKLIDPELPKLVKQRYGT